MKIFLLLIILLGSLPICAQNSWDKDRSDSLKTAIEKSSGKEKIYLMQQLAMEYPASQYKRALSILQQSLELANQQSDLQGMIKAYTAMGVIYNNHGDYDRSSSMLGKALALDRVRHKNEKKEQEIEASNAAKEKAFLQFQKQQTQKYYLTALLFLFLVLIFVLYDRFKIKVQAAHQLEESDRIKARFLSTLTHELLTPTELILEPLKNRIENSSDDREKEELEIIKRNAIRLQLVINQLLDVAKLQSGVTKLQVDKGNLERDLKLMTASFSSLADHKDINYRVEIKKLKGDSYYDRDKLEKIVFNLLSNAFKYTAANGSVFVSVVISEQLLLQVRDSGIGIDEDDIEKIFDRFYQTDGSSEVSAGTGIGLALSRELAELHKGNLSTVSRKGEGSIFTLTLPIERKSYLKTEIKVAETLEVVSVSSVFHNSVLGRTDEKEGPANLPHSHDETQN